MRSMFRPSLPPCLLPRPSGFAALAAPALAAFILVAGTVAGIASAQEAGGLIPGPNAPGLAGAAMAMSNPPPGAGVLLRPPVNRSPPPLKAVNPARARQGKHQEAIARIRGDAGFLAGFHQSQPLAGSRQPPPPPFEPAVTFIQPFIINNFQNPVSIGLGEGNQAGLPPGAGAGAGSGSGSDAGTATSGGTAAGDPPARDGQDALSPPPSMPPLVMPLDAATPGGIAINNIGSTVNLAIGKNNVAQQQVIGSR